MHDAVAVRPVNGLKALLWIVLLGSFSALLFGGWWIFENRAPLPGSFVDGGGRALITGDRIQRGQDLFRELNLMDYGSVLGHGAYVGPDFTAQALHVWTLQARDELARARHHTTYAALALADQDAVAAQVVRDLKVNTYRPASGNVDLPGELAAAVPGVKAHVRAYFRGSVFMGLDRSMFARLTEDDLDCLAEFFLWTAWLSVTPRPGDSVSYSNNWPYAPESGNGPSRGALLWSAISVVVLLGALALMFSFGSPGGVVPEVQERTPRWILEGPPTASQRRLAKYFLVSGALFLVQVLLGGLLAHQYVTGSDFFGIDLGRYLPFPLVRGWHLQLAILWIATAWIGFGLFLAPVLSGREPRHQALGVDVLFGALVVLVVGTLSGLALSVHGKLGSMWWWLGTQGWEYLELGRIWQIVLAAGLGIWFLLVARGLGRSVTRSDDAGDLSRLYLATTLAIPFFYLFAFAINRSTHLTVADYWRWWIIHLWVEGIFEVFAVVVTGALLVRMGLVSGENAVRSLYLQLILLLGSGILGTGHHYYWIGATEAWIAVGAVFSALEVVPLTLLLAEATAHYRKTRSEAACGPYRETFLYLASAAFWNVVGAGLLGFLINLPIVSYYEHGTFLTATHGHGALMGVYGFLALAVMLFAMRHLVPADRWPSRLFGLSCFGLNVGLAGMILITLLPVGVAQLNTAVELGYAAARSPEFYQTPGIRSLLWLRILPDSVFIFMGVVPLLVGLFRVWRDGALLPVEPAQ